QKTQAALRHGLTPVLCVGEGLATRHAGEHIQYTLQQLRKAIQEMTAEQVATLVLAYEPLWAIGTGEVAGPADAQELAAALRAGIAKIDDEATASATRVLSGGSVKAGNVAAIMRQRDTDGVLVGGASLNDEKCANTIRFEHHLVTD